MEKAAAVESAEKKRFHKQSRRPHMKVYGKRSAAAVTVTTVEKAMSLSLWNNILKITLLMLAGSSFNRMLISRYVLLI